MLKFRISFAGLFAFFMLISVIIMQGCITQKKPDYSNIPLTSGDAPYRLPKNADYIDTRGIKHHEINYRWSVSEQWLYESIQNTK